MLRHARERRPPVGDIQAPTLALAYAPGQHDELLAVECIIDARALMPAETDVAATNAYNTATALATTEAARLAIKVLKATSGVFSLVGQARRLACRVFRA